MAFKPLSALRRGFVFLWTALDVTRRTFFNLLFLLILVLIVLFIQKRPRGLFPQRGRAAEA